jgi:protocatechuate 3,4-dioxygenase beta subunit
MKDDEHAGEGLAHDLKRMVELASRRQMLRFLGGASLVPIVGCSSDDTSSSGDAGSAGSGLGGGSGMGNGGSSGSSGSMLDAGLGGASGGQDGSDAGSMDASAGGMEPGTGGTATGGSAGTQGEDTDAGVTSCEQIPTETGGPFPGDGSNGPNALIDGIVRSDIRSSFGTMSGTATGVPLTFKLRLVNTSALCAPLVDYVVYAWHCDKDGLYSLYTAAADQNYLRGVQATDASGTATFLSIFPGCYSGRWPHVHFEIFQNVAGALAGTGKLKVSQFALPTDACNAVFATAGYEQSVTNFANTSLMMDMVFNDGVELQMVTVKGNPTAGYVATLIVGVAV